MSFYFGFNEIANDAPYRAAYNKNEIVLELADAAKDIFDLLNDWREAGKKIGRKLGIHEERQRTLDLLDDLHRSSGQIAHLDNPTSSCKTCRAITLIKGVEE